MRTSINQQFDKLVTVCGKKRHVKNVLGEVSNYSDVCGRQFSPGIFIGSELTFTPLNRVICVSQLFPELEAPRISGNITEKRTVRRVYIPQETQMSILMCGSYFSCDPAEDSNVCFIEFRIIMLALRWTRNNSLKAFGFRRKTNFQVLFTSLDRSVIFFSSCNPVISSSCVHACFLELQSFIGLLFAFFFVYFYCEKCIILGSSLTVYVQSFKEFYD